ncbi:MAG: DUF2752 domain-containing protein [Chitinophagaceae bacterium]|jgi:hypothetical protein|nr:DUF2752 domain-containing protein [Chitinophagaceae bacterium]
MQEFLLTGFYSKVVLWLEKNMFMCPSKKFLHMDCPGCGLQRSYVALLKGDFATSFHLYPAAIPILMMVTYLLLHLIFKFKHGATILTALYIFCAMIILVHYIYRIVTHQNLT